MHDRLERIESIKAGSLGGMAVGIGYGAIEFSRQLLSPAASPSLFSLGLAAAIAVTSGFLFGVTYRYIIRTDRNDHLNSGAVLAFGLIRGLAQVDVDRFQLTQLGTDASIVANSILLFAIARYAIDGALSASWILPFARSSQPESRNVIASANLTTDGDLHVELAERTASERLSG